MPHEAIGGQILGLGNASNAICYNHGRFLPDALSTLPVDVPLTIINDASTDDTGALIEALSKERSFKLIDNERNLNQWASLNKAVEGSDNNLFIVLNADDCLLEGTIPAIIEVFSRFPTVHLVGGGSRPFTTTNELAVGIHERFTLDPSSIRIVGPGEASAFRSPSDLNMTMSSCSFTRSAWEAAGGFLPFEKRTCAYDDRDFQMRVCSLFHIAYIGAVLALYRSNSSQRRGDQ